MSNQFKSENELYNYLDPVLKTKMVELHSYGYSFIKEKDIYTYLKNYKWVNSDELSVYDLVDDIIHTDNVVMMEAILKRINNDKERA